MNFTTESLKNKVTITEVNFDELMTLFLYGYKQSDYNSECFSTTEVMRQMVCDRSVDLMLNETVKAGYDPQALLAPIEKKLNMALGVYPRTDLKQVTDGNFKITVNGSVIDLGKAYWNGGVSDASNSG